MFVLLWTLQRADFLQAVELTYFLNYESQNLAETFNSIFGELQ